MRPSALWRLGLLLASLALPFAAAHADDIKEISPTVCQPYTSSPIDPALLRVRADGITNNYNASKFVICPIHRDSQSAWYPESSSHINVWFRRTGSSPLTSNQCTLTLGWLSDAPLASVVRYAEAANSTSGFVRFEGADFTTNTNYNTASLICRIAPGHTLDFIYVEEINT